MSLVRYICTLQLVDITVIHVRIIQLAIFLLLS